MPQIYVGSEQHPLRGWYLQHAYPDTRDPEFTPKPFLSVTRLGSLGCQETVEYLQEQGVGAKFAQAAYIERRNNTEAWLYKHAKRAGVEPECNAPTYFKLEPTHITFHRPNFTVTSVPAQFLPENLMSFTVYDSFYHYAAVCGEPFPNSPPDLVPGVLNALEVRTLVSSNPDVDATFFSGDPDQPYIECQFWRPEHYTLEVIAGRKNPDIERLTGDLKRPI